MFCTRLAHLREPRAAHGRADLAALQIDQLHAQGGRDRLAPVARACATADDGQALNFRAGAAQRKLEDASIKAKLLGGAEIDDDQVDDPRQPLMDWMRAPGNPYFARAIVNRIWANYFGRGIVDPPDDLNLANPPSNKQLFDYLATGLVAHHYDLKWLHREIARSHAYQRSWRANDTNKDDERNFSRALIRRLPAEVALDAIQQATATNKKLEAVATDLKGRRIGVQPTADHSRTEFGLAVFGKPLRTVNCDCEREAEPSLLQALFVRNDKDVVQALDRKDGWLSEKSVREAKEEEPLVRESFLRTINRPPTDAELTRAQRHLASAGRAEGLRDLLWALLNTQEFITNH